MELISKGDVTRFLERFKEGDREAIDGLLPVVYEQLHRIACSQMERERRDHTLQPTALVNEAYLQLVSREKHQFNDRRHFYRAAAIIMRTILVNHARDRNRVKRGNGIKPHPLQTVTVSYESTPLDILALDEALESLADTDQRLLDLVELRFFAGLSVKDAAETLGVSERTVRNDWNMARAWLWQKLKP